MKRIPLIFGLIASVIVTALVVLAYDKGSLQSTAGQQEQETSAARQNASDARSASHPADGTETDFHGKAQQASGGHPERTVTDTDTVTKKADDEWGYIDEETEERLKKEATEGLRALYSLLFEEVGLSTDETEALIALLVEESVASTTIAAKTGFRRGVTIDKEDREQRIALIIGEQKTQQFLAREQYIHVYSRVRHMNAYLQLHEVPLTEAQRDGLFEILVQVEDQYQAPPATNADPRSIESVEQTVARINDRMRLVLELAPNVLFPEQVQRLHEQHEELAYRRAQNLEWQKKLQQENPEEDIPSFYLPN